MENNKLDKMVYIYSVDTSSFYNEKEHELDKKLTQFKHYKNTLSEITRILNRFRLECNRLIKKEDECAEEELEKEFILLIKKYNVFQNEINEYLVFDEEKRQYVINKKSNLWLNDAYLNSCIKHLKEQLDVESEKHTHRRKLRIDSLTENNKISLFDSYLTRSLGMINDEVSTDIIVVRAYRYVIFEKLIKEGFIYNGERYEYFASSAGQIRNKKSCFVRTSLLNKNKHEIRNRLMCGLSIGKINRLGGINQNKFQAYLSLTNSASTPWENFDIDRCIVVDDMELEVEGYIDYINHEDYLIENKKDKIPIEFMDGAGIILPSISDKSFQFRMNWFKGLLIPFDYIKFINRYCDGESEIKDIYGKSWNIKKDNISVIFTKSQFKLWKYYKDWDEYKKYFKKYNCEASICKVEEEIFEDKPINYQMIQSLNFTDDELLELSKNNREDIENIGSSKEIMLRVMGADDSNEKKNYFQTALSIYPELLNDAHSKQTIKDRKKSMVKEAKSGRLLIPNTKRTYISPDLFAFAQWLFLRDKNPKGLLKKNEVSCSLFENIKINLLRSPHLFREHGVRKNKVNNDTKEWFITNNVYTSVHDMISKQLMFDVDGDDAIIVSNKLFVEKAEEQMKGIVPLEYTLATGKNSKITNENIVASLKAAYSKNIGEISNLITKIWNSDEPDLDLIKVLCMENNAIIDYAKTLWMPERPDDIKEKIKKYNQQKVPYFFRYAKDKDEEDVAEYDSEDGINDSTMNRLSELIHDKRINFTKVIGKFDYKNLMRNKRVKTDGELEKEIIDKYENLDRAKHKKIKNQLKNQSDTNNNTKLNIYSIIRNELLDICRDRYYVVDVLVRYLYYEKKSAFKDTLWRSFGKELLSNVEYNVLGVKRCMSCNEEIDNTNNRQKYCVPCFQENRRRYKTEKQKEYRNNVNVDN